MKILILTFYYYPDLCAGSFRSTALVEQLRSKMDEGTEIEVITTLPNRYATYSVDAPEFEEHRGFIVHRIALPGHRSGMFDQAVAFAYFAKKVQRYVKGKHYDLIYATSSRLMAAALGSWVARQTKTKLYLDIRDIFVDTISDVFPSWLAFVSKPVFSMVEKWTFSKAKQINIVSKGFAPYFKKRYPSTQLSYFTNGIDAEFLKVQPVNALKENDIITVVYAGNIGEGQGLHKIIPALAKQMEGKVAFRIIGDGGCRKRLSAALEVCRCTNVQLLSPCSREALLQEYQKSDILFLHLNDYPAFRKVLPSKIFEYASFGKPIWAGVSGYAAEFIQHEIKNAVVFPPCNIQGALEAFRSIRLVVEPRFDFIKKYERSFIMQAMASEILALANS